MTVTELLLVSALALLVSPAVANPHPNLKRAFYLAEKFNKSVTREFYVEDVKHLYESGCGDKFFCKVYDILHNHENITEKREEEELVKNLGMFVRHRNVSCEELIKDMPSTGIEIQIPKLIDYLCKCIKQRNYHGDHNP